MIYFEDWWNVGENCLNQKYSGVLADDSQTEDICISNEESLNKFKKDIAIDLIKYNDKLKKFESYSNKNDVFLSNKISIDFDKNLLFIFLNAEVKEILYSKLFQCYMVTFSENSVEEHSYCAAVVRKILDNSNNIQDIKFQIMNEKPKPIKINRPDNFNNEY